MPAWPPNSEPFRFTSWAPDRPDIGGDHLLDALNVLPKDGYYCSSNGLTPSPSQAALSAICTGAFAYRRYDANTEIILGTNTGLFTTISDGTIVDISRTSGGAYTGTLANPWSFAQGGDTVYATNLADVIQKYAVADTDFAALAGSPPKAKFIAIHKGFMFVGYTDTSPLNLRWSSNNNFTSWTPGTNQADSIILPDYGAITGLIHTDALWVFQENAVRRAVPVGPPEVMQIDIVVRNIGALPFTIIAFGNLIFFASENGFFQFDGMELIPIGHGLVDNWWKDDRRDDALHRMSVTIDPQEKHVIWNYISRATAGDIPDSQIVYNYATKTWSYRRERIERVVSFFTFSQTLDSLSGVIADSLLELVDSPSFIGGKRLIGGINDIHKLGTFTGARLPGTLQSCFNRVDGEGKRVALHRVRVMSDCEDVTVHIVGKETLKGSPIISEAGSYNAADDTHKLRFGTRWPSVKIDLVGEWSKIQGFTDLDWTPLGEQ